MSQKDTQAGASTVGHIVQEALRASARWSEQASPEVQGPGGTALVPVRPPEPEAARPPARRTSAPFLAQLIATDRQLPQTRERRRAEPREALAAYGAAARLIKRRPK